MEKAYLCHRLSIAWSWKKYGYYHKTLSHHLHILYVGYDYVFILFAAKNLHQVGQHSDFAHVKGPQTERYAFSVASLDQNPVYMQFSYINELNIQTDL